MKILILGHQGMLGHMVYKYLSTKKECKVITTNLRWSSNGFKEFVENFIKIDKGDYIINCIGAIHQKSTFNVNTDLPIWLDNKIKSNKCLVGNIAVKDIQQQLIELKNFV